jgi:transcriptional regulator GlxA family with amidase domain
MSWNFNIQAPADWLASFAAELGLDVGFGDVSHFIRTFREEVGRTPAAFRKAVLFQA